MNLKEKAQSLPTTPGVYLMKDSQGIIIYVGKAKNLKRRVQSYFQNSRNHSQKVVKLKNNIKEFDVIYTDTEFEAFMLECHLIREIKPYFNRKMKSPKGYTFIAINMNSEFPKIEVTNAPATDENCLSFGPFITKHTVEKAIQGLKEFCQIQCSGPSQTNSPCLNYSLGLCFGMCCKDSAVKDYREIISRIIALLNGEDTSLLEEMQKKMRNAAENFEFETAGKYRNYMESVRFLLQKEKVIHFTEENKNIAIIEFLTEQTFKLFLIKRNKILFSERYQLQSDRLEELATAIKSQMITYFKTNQPHFSQSVSKEEIDEAQIIYSYLENGNCHYMVIPDNWPDIDDDELNDQITQLFIKPKKEPPY
ncbi:GIY-YIG nuclease family protein [Bacillus sp. BRMEA1]|nr:GIY-YIG nuclease family protein [Neobacillus endophyticus]